MYLLIAVYLFVLGTIFGDFLNAFVGRFHDKQDWVKSRSKCDNCGRQLKFRDMIPVLSWLALRGKCQQCHKKIHWSNPAIEIITGLLFLISYKFWPLGFSGLGLMWFVVWLFLLVSFMAISVYDFRWYEIPTEIIYLDFIILSSSIVVSFIVRNDISILTDALYGVIFGSGIFYLIYKISDKLIGFGDVRLGVIYGMLVGGPVNALMVIGLGSFVGLLFVIPTLRTKKVNMKTQIPFGPMLLIATFIVYIFGARILDWYTSKLI